MWWRLNRAGTLTCVSYRQATTPPAVVLPDVDYVHQQTHRHQRLIGMQDQHGVDVFVGQIQSGQAGFKRRRLPARPAWIIDQRNGQSGQFR